MDDIREIFEIARLIVPTNLFLEDLDLVAALCSRVFVLDEGLVVASGKTAEVLSEEALMLRHGVEKPHSLLHRHPH